MVKKGDMVLFHFGKDEELGSSKPNGQASPVPAVVVNVWSEVMVNLRVFTDGIGAPLWKTSVAKKTTGNKVAGHCWEPL